MEHRPIPLQQINAFEAAARRLSFSQAAKELNVQQPAISRHIAVLEQSLGTKLFIRTKPRLTLTEEGEILNEAVTQGFGSIRQGIEIIHNRAGDETIVVTASIGFTSLYLLPRLAEFQSLYPKTKLQIVTRDQNPSYDLKNSDIVIIFGNQGGLDVRSKKIFSESMVTVCHPNLLLAGDYFSREELAQQKLLYLSDRDHNDDWKQFFRGTDIAIPKPPAHNTYVSYMVYLRAIQNGLGIGIGWRPLLDEFLINGTLVLACEHEQETHRGYFCSITSMGEAKAGTREFLDWISNTWTFPSFPS